MKETPMSRKPQTRRGQPDGPRDAHAGGTKPSAALQRGTAGLIEEHVPESGLRAVTFEYFNAAAGEVRLAGSFNGWQPQTTPLARRRDGLWSVELLLQPGHHEYRFVVDGQWLDDPLAARYAANPYGGLNGVVEVKATAAPAARRA